MYMYMYVCDCPSKQQVYRWMGLISYLSIKLFRNSVKTTKFFINNKTVARYIRLTICKCYASIYIYYIYLSTYLYIYIYVCMYVCKYVCITYTQLTYVFPNKQVLLTTDHEFRNFEL